MTLDEYQQEALRTAPRNIEAYGIPRDIREALLSYTEDRQGMRATIDEVDSALASLMRPLLEKQDQMIWSLGLAGEAGEFADMMKKVHGHGHPLDPVKATKELGDVLWYLSVLAHSLGVTLEQVAQLNVAKLRERYPEGFSIQNSMNRKDGG